MNKELAVNIAKASMSNAGYGWNMDIDKFDWVPGVGLYGIYKVYEATKEKSLLDFLINWTDKHIDEATNVLTINSVCPLLTITYLYEIKKTNKYLEICKTVADRIITEAPLTKEGALEHTVTENVKFNQQLWADTVFMACLFLLRMGKLADSKYSDFAVKQIKLHIKYLQDNNTGLCYHGWDSDAKNHMSGIFWARANAWIIYASTVLLEEIDDFDGRNDVICDIKKLAKGLKNCPRKNGGFCTVLDDETSYDEASATAGIVAGLLQAKRLGIIDNDFDSICKEGIDYLKSVIAADGKVMHVSTGTPVMKDKEAYKNIACKSPTLYGQGLACVLLCLE